MHGSRLVLEVYYSQPRYHRLLPGSLYVEFKFFSLILDSSVGLSAGIQSAGDLIPDNLGSNPAFSRGRQLVSFRFEYRLPVPELRN